MVKVHSLPVGSTIELPQRLPLEPPQGEREAEEWLEGADRGVSGGVASAS